MYSFELRRISDFEYYLGGKQYKYNGELVKDVDADFNTNPSEFNCVTYHTLIRFNLPEIKVWYPEYLSFDYDYWVVRISDFIPKHFPNENLRYSTNNEINLLLCILRHAIPKKLPFLFSNYDGEIEIHSGKYVNEPHGYYDFLIAEYGFNNIVWGTVDLSRWLVNEFDIKKCKILNWDNSELYKKLRCKSWYEVTKDNLLEVL